VQDVHDALLGASQADGAVGVVQRHQLGAVRSDVRGDLDGLVRRRMREHAVADELREADDAARDAAADAVRGAVHLVGAAQTIAHLVAPAIFTRSSGATSIWSPRIPALTETTSHISAVSSRKRG